MAALVVGVVGACTSAPVPAETPTAPTPSATPSARPSATVPSIAGVSPECVKAIVRFLDGPGWVDGPLSSCASLEELEAAARALGVGHPDWAADAYDFCSTGDRSAPICGTLPGVMHEVGARTLCQRTQPDGIYDVTNPVQPLSEPAPSDVGWIQLAAFRDLDGNISPGPSDLRDDDFYVIPYYRNAGAELVACVVLQAFAFENWQDQFRDIYQIHASDAVVWVVEVASEERLGAPWRLHPGEDGGRIWVGERRCCDVGVRAPTEADIVAAIEEFLGRD